MKRAYRSIYKLRAWLCRCNAMKASFLLCLHIRKCGFRGIVTLDRVTSTHMSKMISCVAATDSIAGRFCE